jgi:chitin disaccharide deacetylase
MADGGSGLLIVNADDLGYSPEVTDAIVRAHEAGSLTSATAMVLMSGSEEAATRLADRGLPTGLHLNLIEPYTSSSPVERVRERQLQVCRAFGAHRAHRWIYDPRLRQACADVISDQLEEYLRLFGAPPSHWDGHRHWHLSPTALVAASPLGGYPTRRSHSFRRGEKSLPNRMFRNAIGVVARRRFGSTDYFFSVRDLAPEFGGYGLDDALALSRTHAVEIMVHPSVPDELAFLLAAAWRERISGLELGSFRDLPARAKP